MATKVLVMDVANMIEPIMGLDEYQQALLLFRFRNRPIGKVILTVINERLSSTELYDFPSKPEL